MLAIVVRDARLFASYRTRFAASLFGPLFAVTLFHFVAQLVRSNVLGSEQAYFASVVVGLAILETLTSTVALTPMSLRSELLAGTFERLVLSPFGAASSTVASMIFPALQAMVTATITIVYAVLLFGMPLHWPSAVLAIPATVLGVLAFAPLGVLVAATVIVAKQALSTVTVIVAGLSFVSGIYFPVHLLPLWLHWAASVQPLTPAVDLVRHLLVGTPQTQSAWLAVLRLVGFAVVLTPLSLLALEAGLRNARRRSTIVEY
jgi:ABC-2 type transport system permease protein